MKSLKTFLNMGHCGFGRPSLLYHLGRQPRRACQCDMDGNRRHIGVLHRLSFLQPVHCQKRDAA